MTMLSQAEGDEILEILVQACDAVGSQEMPNLLARISVLLGREVGAVRLLAVVEKARSAASINTNKGQ